MKNKLWMVILITTLAVLTACSDDESEELKMLDVDFPLPETADIDEVIELKAIVTYGDEKVTDAQQMEFEYWEEGNRDDSTFLEAENNGDGTYTAEVSFDREGTFEIYAHTTTRDLHTMPKKSITIGQSSDDGEEEDDDS